MSKNIAMAPKKFVLKKGKKSYYPIRMKINESKETNWNKTINTINYLQAMWILTPPN